MFHHQPFTQAELDADPRLATLAQDKRRLLALMEQIVEQCPPSEARSRLAAVLVNQGAAERQREAAHYAAMQAENVRRGWRPATLREILGEPDYVPTHDTALDDEQRREQDDG